MFYPFKGLKYHGGVRVKNKFKRTDKIRPLLTIITVVKNGANTIEKCIKSVIDQKDVNIEHIIIDGGSSDSTVSILKNIQKILNTGLVKKMREFMTE